MVFTIGLFIIISLYLLFRFYDWLIKITAKYIDISLMAVIIYAVNAGIIIWIIQIY